MQIISQIQVVETLLVSGNGEVLRLTGALSPSVCFSLLSGRISTLRDETGAVSSFRCFLCENEYRTCRLHLRVLLTLPADGT